jgi:outer membrane protein OmpA-like peptidoglycan-associated protein
MVDLTLNLSNMIMGNYNPKRPFQLSAFVGLGANFGFGNDDAWDNYNKYVKNKGVKYAEGFEPFRYIWGSKTAYDAAGNKYFEKDGNNQTLLNVHFGLIGDVRLSDRVALNLELQANTLSDRYNSKCAHNSDWYFNALAGLKFALGKTYESRVKEEKVKEVVVERIVEKQIPCPEVQAPTPAPIVEQKAEPLRRDVFFTINSTTIDAGEQHKVQELAEYLKANPRARVQITGYADKGTGNATINSRLAEKRAAVVLDVLVKNYGIARDRISVDSKGDTVQPFAEQVKNRVSICVAE